MTALPRATELGLVACHVCRHVIRDVPPAAVGHAIEPEGYLACPRCGSALHRRKPASYSRTWALLIAAFLMYIPANVLPIFRTASPGVIDDNTILSGVRELWIKGSSNLAIIVFIASIVVPTMKFVVLSLLLWTSRRGSRWARQPRAALYRVVEFVGYWSMLDVFVVALLTALVRFGLLSHVEPLPGVIFFGITVVLTMLASMSFDPRLIWDGKDTND